jgi:exonuclease VII small subunit
MGSPSEPPAFTSTISDLKIILTQLVNAETLRVEFSQSAAKNLVIKKLILKKEAIKFFNFNPDPLGNHIWLITPRTINGFKLGLDVSMDFIIPEIASTFEITNNLPQAPKSKDQLLAESLALHDKFLSDTKVWNARKHASGLTFREIMDFKHGLHEINGYFIWRGTWSKGGSRRSDGFHEVRISSNENWNNEIRLFVKRGHNLFDAIRIQDELYMELFYAKIKALLSFYMSTPSVGPKPRTISAGPKPRARPQNRLNSKKAPLESAIRASEKGLQLIAKSYESFSEIRAAVEHFQSKQHEKEISKNINDDVQLLSDYLVIITNEASR